MLKIRLQRIGRRNDPSYRVVVVESAVAAKKGVPVEIVGFYDTVRKKTSLNSDRVQHWLSSGAKPSDTLHNILVTNGIIEGKKQNVLPRKKPIVKEEVSDEAAASDMNDAPSDEETTEENAPAETPDAEEAVAGNAPTETPDTSQETPQEEPEKEPEADASTPPPSKEG